MFPEGRSLPDCSNCKWGPFLYDFQGECVGSQLLYALLAGDADEQELEQELEQEESTTQESQANLAA